MEPLTSITALQKYDELIQKRPNKEFQDTLMAFKDACDKIEKMKGKMSYSAIASVSNRHVNTIKADIEGHRAYVQLRQAEYEAKRKSVPAQKASNQKVAAQRPRYPASDLDYKTKSFIDEMWLEINETKNRNRLLENMLSEIRKEVLDKTREKPLDARKMICGGLDDTGSMAIVVAGGNTSMIPLTPRLQQALEKVLQLSGHHKTLCLEQGRLILKAPSRDFLLLYPNELQEIAAAIGKEVPSGE